ncbi:MAG TPA: DUF2076 domain-containing protein [Rhodospirillaceae bacterium]|nr:DUF2076 domain-containing protein [Rhodospirillaceae bacterium]
MTPQERDLIQGVFDRLARAGTGPKDPEAEALIQDGLRRQPDATYALVQAVIVQEMGLNQASQRINELQRQLDQARAAAPAPAAGGGSFLGNASPWAGGSVPRSGPMPAVQPQPQAPSAAWGQPQPAAPAASPWAGQPQQPSPMGGFLRNAATMAAGVAGGTLIAEGISSLFGGHHFGGGYGGGFGGGMAGGSPWGGSPGVVEENVTVNNYYGGNDGQDAGAQDSGVADASYDDSSFDDGGGSFDDTSDA